MLLKSNDCPSVGFETATELAEGPNMNEIPVTKKKKQATAPKHTLTFFNESPISSTLTADLWYISRNLRLLEGVSNYSAIS